MGTRLDLWPMGTRLHKGGLLTWYAYTHVVFSRAMIILYHCHYL